MFFIHVSLKMGNEKKTGFEIVAKALRAAYSVLNEFYLKLKNVLMLLIRALFFNFLHMVTTLFRWWSPL